MDLDKAKPYAIGALAALFVVILVLVIARSCSNSLVVIEKPEVEVDTSEVDDKTTEAQDEAKAEAEGKIEVLEKEHAEAIEKFDDDQRKEYEEMKDEGPDAVAEWLSDFNRDL